MELLKKLYEIHSPSGREKKIKRFIRTYVSESIEGAKLVDNRDGNIYIVKGDSDTYPCVVAHLDQVQSSREQDFKAVETEDVIFGWAPSTGKFQGLGADDKNGIWIALKCLEEFDVLKVAFFVGEEVGCIGSGKADMTFFENCRFIVQPDRKGSSDLITSICGEICSSDFERDIQAPLFGYTATSGLMTDVLELSERGVGVSCINLSCGYYKPHTEEEYTIKRDIVNCLNFVRFIITNCTDVYPHKYDDGYSYGRYNGVYSHYYGGHSVYGGYGGYDTYRSYTSSGNKMGVKIIKSTDYSDLDSFTDQLMFENVGYKPEELWPYVSSDLETYGITEDQFLEVAYEYWWQYNEDWMGETYGASYSDDKDWLYD